MTAFPVVMPLVTDRFNSLDHIGWYGSAYLLGMCVMTRAAAKVYMLFNGSWGYIASIFIWGSGCLLCARAPSSAVVIVGRAVSGYGAAACLATTSFVIDDIFPSSAHHVEAFGSSATPDLWTRAFKWLITSSVWFARIIGPL